MSNEEPISAVFLERLLRRLDEFVFDAQRSVHAREIDLPQTARHASRVLQEDLDVAQPWLASGLADLARREVKRARRVLAPMADDALVLRRLALATEEERAAFDCAHDLVLQDLERHREKAHDRIQALRLHKLHAQVGDRLNELLRTPPDAGPFLQRFAAVIAERRDTMAEGWAIGDRDPSAENAHRLMIDTSKLETVAASLETLRRGSCSELLAMLERPALATRAWHDDELLDDLLVRCASRPALLRDRLDLVGRVVRTLERLRESRAAHLAAARADLHPDKVRAAVAPVLDALEQRSTAR